MMKNLQNAWLSMLILKTSWIPEIHKSPAELLNFRKFQTNLPMIDLNQGHMNESEIESLADKHHKMTSKDNELPKLDVDTPVLYNKNPGSSKVKCPKWAKGTVKNREKP